MKLFASFLREKFVGFIKDEEGASAIEYAVIAGLIIAGAILTIGTIGDNVLTYFTTISTNTTPTP